MIVEWLNRWFAEPWERIPMRPDLRESYAAKGIRLRDPDCPLHSGAVIWGSGMPCLCWTPHTLIEGKECLFDATHPRVERTSTGVHEPAHVHLELDVSGHAKP